MTQILLVLITGSMLDNTCFGYLHVYSIQGVMYFKCNSQGVLFVQLVGLRVFVCVEGVCLVFLPF